MNRIIRQKIPLPIQMKMDFVQNIMGKYGLSRGRNPFQALILRKYRMLYTEPVVAKNSSWVYTSIYYNPAQQIIASPQSGSRFLTIIPNIIKVTHHSSEQGGSKFNYSSPLLREVVHERVRGHREIAQSINIYRSRQSSQSSQSPSYSSVPEPAPIDLEGPQHSLMIHNEVKSQVINQMKTVQAYISNSGAAVFSIDRPLTHKQKVQNDRNRPTVPPTLALEQRNETARDISHSDSGVDHSIAFLSKSSSAKPPESLRLVLGKGIDSVLGNIKAYYGQTDAMNHSVGMGTVHVTSYTGHQKTTRVQKTVRLQELAQLQDLTRLQDRLKRLNAIPVQSAAKLQDMPRQYNPENLQNATITRLPTANDIHHEMRLPFPPAQQESPSSRILLTATGEQEQALLAINKDSKKNSTLIFRRSESKAADAETTQKPQGTQESQLQPREALFQANPFPKQPNNKSNIGVEELNLLAERVFQVLDKRMSIRKDRRGLR